jgi:hypothetical protein
MLLQRTNGTTSTTKELAYKTVCRPNKTHPQATGHSIIRQTEIAGV